jgi:7-cyano-7-deazaguanine synthase
MSGGLDSSTLAAYLKKRKGHDVRGIHVSYGHKSRLGELASLDAIQKSLDIPLIKLTLDLAQHLYSSLTDTKLTNPNCHHASEEARVTFVPNRNAIFLSIAYAVAMSQDCDAIAYAAHADDYKLYPDCRDAFTKALHEALKLGNDGYGYPLKLLNPFVNMAKSDVLLLGESLGLELSKTWTCYNSEVVQCGQCAACHERQAAFAAARIQDTTLYANTSTQTT